jgi:hypothetical protein
MLCLAGLIHTISSRPACHLTHIRTHTHRKHRCPLPTTETNQTTHTILPTTHTHACAVSSRTHCTTRPPTIPHTSRHRPHPSRYTAGHPSNAPAVSPHAATHTQTHTINHATLSRHRHHANTLRTCHTPNHAYAPQQAVVGTKLFMRSPVDKRDPSTPSMRHAPSAQSVAWPPRSGSCHRSRLQRPH